MGPGDDASCGGVPGLTCLMGQPLVTPTGITSPGHACAPRPAGSAGPYSSRSAGTAVCSGTGRYAGGATVRAEAGGTADARKHPGALRTQ